LFQTWPLPVAVEGLRVQQVISRNEGPFVLQPLEVGSMHHRQHWRLHEPKPEPATHPWPWLKLRPWMMLHPQGMKQPETRLCERKKRLSTQTCYWVPTPSRRSHPRHHLKCWRPNLFHLPPSIPTIIFPTFPISLCAPTCKIFLPSIIKTIPLHHPNTIPLPNPELA
jgi:hypothetical protein